jgi:hypothetical protein
VTRVRILGKDGYDLRGELLSSDTSREALATYDFIDSPIQNAVVVETATLGGALALLNDLDWYLTRYARASEVLEPSVSGDEWLSRRLAERLYESRIDADETAEFYVVRGVEDGEVLDPLYSRNEPAEYDLADADFVTTTRVDETEF